MAIGLHKEGYWEYNPPRTPDGTFFLKIIHIKAIFYNNRAPVSFTVETLTTAGLVEEVDGNLPFDFVFFQAKFSM